MKVKQILKYMYLLANRALQARWAHDGIEYARLLHIIDILEEELKDRHH